MTVESLLADPGVLGSWTLAADRSSVRFANRTLWGLLTVKGEFTEFAGSGQINADRSVTGRLTIAAASLRTGIAKRDEHLRSADFFDVENSAEITVDVAGATPSGEHTADLDLTLSIRGTTLPVPVQATVTRLGNNTLHVVGRTAVDRTRWGVSGNMLAMMPTRTLLVADTLFVRG